MNKKIILGLLLIGMILSGIFLYQSVLAPAQIEPTNLDTVFTINEDTPKLITIRIDKNDHLFVNEMKTDRKHIIPKLDSLSALGFEKSKMILHTEAGASIDLIVKLTEEINKTGRKVNMSLKK